ncbi:MAG: hypothetical protein EPO07_02500 [Verrucomicrobia bacterium]|nr:MAG: hypothetical protein EPO07_02500 [Verrucomicrobiota bacterium]
MTSRSKKISVAVAIVFAAFLLWWGLKPEPKPAPPVEVKAAPVEAPKPVAPAPVETPKPVEPAPVVEPPKPAEQPKPPVVEPPPRPAPEPVKEVPPPAPAPAPVKETPPPAPAPVVVPEASLQVEKKPEPKLNKVFASYRLGLNLTADFRKLGGFSRLHDPGPDTGSTEERFYDNGYNRVDSSTNNFGYTRYWGYSSGTVSNNQIVMEVSTSPTNGISPGNDAGLNHGFEIGYSREFLRREKYRAGLDTAFGFTTLEVDDTRTLQNVVNRVVDVFQVPNQVFVVPPPPYNGSYDTPGPVIGSNPLEDPSARRVVIAQAATITGRRQLNANIFMIRVGPYLEIPLDKEEKYAFTLNGGLNLVIGDLDFRYTETVDIAGAGSIVGPGSQSRAARGAQTDFLVGAYVGGQFSYAIDENWGVFAGAQFQTAGRAVNSKGGKEAVLDMGQTVVVQVGVSYSF